MSDRTLAIITTRLPPQPCGIGAYSWQLRQHWPGNGTRVQFLVMEGGTTPDTDALGDRVTDFNGNATTLAAALDALGPADVLLHYAGRGYHRLGAPTWLPRVLTRWKHRNRSSRLMVFFHEVPGELPITSRHYWLGLLNARIVRRIAALADVIATNTEPHAEKLRRLAGRSDIALLPVGSNIEAFDATPQTHARTEFAIFGLSFGRLQTLQFFDQHIRNWTDTGVLTRLHIIGPGGDKFSAQADALINEWPLSDVVINHGTLRSTEVAQRLRSVGFTLTNVSRDTWSKSGTFMACAANHCPIVIAGPRGDSMPLCYTVHTDEVPTISAAELTQRTDALSGWYRENADWPAIAQRIAALWTDAEARS